MREEIIREIKNKISEGKVILGLNRTIKMLKLGKVEKVFVASNTPEHIKEDLKYYSSLAKAEYHELDLNNEELGAIAGKPFKVSVLSILK